MFTYVYTIQPKGFYFKIYQKYKYKVKSIQYCKEMIHGKLGIVSKISI